MTPDPAHARPPAACAFDLPSALAKLDAQMVSLARRHRGIQTVMGRAVGEALQLVRDMQTETASMCLCIRPGAVFSVPPDPECPAHGDAPKPTPPPPVVSVLEISARLAGQQQCAMGNHVWTPWLLLPDGSYVTRCTRTWCGHAVGDPVSERRPRDRTQRPPPPPPDTAAEGLREEMTARAEQYRVQGSTTTDLTAFGIDRAIALVEAAQQRLDGEETRG
jgi:hypothetical protein